MLIVLLHLSEGTSQNHFHPFILCRYSVLRLLQCPSFMLSPLVYPPFHHSLQFRFVISSLINQ